MKKTFLFFLMVFMMPWTFLNAQVGGNDYIFMLDNGGSTTEERYIDMKRNSIKLIEQLLACNRKNRVAVVQYGAGKYGDTSGVYTPLIYIESDFTGDQFTAQNFERRLDFGDHFNESLGIIGDALDGNPNADIISPQTVLTNDQPLKVVVFTDAERNTGGLNGSYLVNYSNTTLNSPGAFENAMKFKINRGAQFTMIHANTNNQAVEAAASIASQVGPYTGPLETNTADPDLGMPRLYFSRPNGYGGHPIDESYWRELAGNICDSSGWGTLNFKYEPGQCINATQGAGGTYSLPQGAAFVQIRMFMVNIADGSEYPVGFNPTYGAGGSFIYYFQPSDFDYAVNAGATGEYKLKALMVYTYGGANYNVFSWNNYPYFDYDIVMKCPLLKTAKPLTDEKAFKLTPNPTNGLFKVILNKEIRSEKLEIRDLSGNTVYNKVLRGEKEIEIDLSSRKEGIYIVNVITDKNENYSEKIIKK